MVCVEINLQCLILVLDEPLLAKCADLGYLIYEILHLLLGVLDLVEPHLGRRCSQRCLYCVMDFSESLHWKVVLEVSVSFIHVFQDSWNFRGRYLKHLYSLLCNA